MLHRYRVHVADAILYFYNYYINQIQIHSTNKTVEKHDRARHREK